MVYIYFSYWYLTIDIKPIKYLLYVMVSMYLTVTFKSDS